MEVLVAEVEKPHQLAIVVVAVPFLAEAEVVVVDQLFLAPINGARAAGLLSMLPTNV